MARSFSVKSLSFFTQLKMRDDHLKLLSTVIPKYLKESTLVNDLEKGSGS